MRIEVGGHNSFTPTYPKNFQKSEIIHWKQHLIKKNFVTLQKIFLSPTLFGVCKAAFFQ